MNKHEFRIGNKILLGSEVCTLSELFEDEFKTPEHGFGDYSHPQLKGIPLTEEWLLKFGYRLIKNDNPSPSDWYWCKPNFHGSIWNGTNEFTGITPKLYVEYVHQLQNLYFALTGKELVASI